MIRRATGPQCLSSRVSALADGSLPDDVRDRALAHVTSCPDCRADLEAERLLRARLQSLPAPHPSSSLVASLLAMGEPGGPLPPRAGHVPGSPRPAPATIRREPGPDVPWRGQGSLPFPTLPWHRATSGRRSISRSAGPPARPGPSSRPARPSRLGSPGGPNGPDRHGGTRRRAVAGATAGAVGAGVIAAALASGLPAGPPATSAAQVPVRTSAVGAQPVALRPDLRSATGTRQAEEVTGIDAVFSLAGSDRARPLLSSPSAAGVSALPGVTTTLLHHLLATPASRSPAPVTSLLVGRSDRAATGSVAGDRYPGFEYLAGASR